MENCILLIRKDYSKMENNKNLVSVVMVTYNHEKYIGQAIESVVTQVFNGTLEILIGDDGSSDNTVDIIKKYAEEYKNIRLFAHENRGLSQNVYELFMNANGEYIAVLEGDDYWIDREKIQKQIECLKRNGCIATACNSVIIDEQGEERGFWSKFNDDREISLKDIEKYQYQLFHPSAVLFRNFFAGSKEQYNIIATAHKMSGNHTGLINLLGSKGKIYLQQDSYVVWRKIIKVGGTNYSSQKEMTVEKIHANLTKYINYKKYYGDLYNFNDWICMYYVECVKKMFMEVQEVLKNFGMILVCYCVKRVFFKLIWKKR